MWLRLGIPFTARPHHCSCRNQSVIDEHVDHNLTCKQFNGSIKSRHDLIVREIKSLCHHAFNGQIATLDSSELLVMLMETPQMVTSWAYRVDDSSLMKLLHTPLELPI